MEDTRKAQTEEAAGVESDSVAGETDDQNATHNVPESADTNQEDMESLAVNHVEAEPADSDNLENIKEEKVPAKPSYQSSVSDNIDDNEFVVHVDESDTNLDYDLGDKPEERDAPTPTKDESMDVDADVIQTGDGAAKTASKDTKSSLAGSKSSQASKRFVTMKEIQNHGLC